ncbi:serine/threonine-protein phosphatase [Piscinibacter sp. Jin2]|uniref:Serine/threonine-protein phosphatase n=1 Tax=Aquariibacter lacus TaxID=2801332 RepID=A0A9X1BN76_9BURK|nr:serine/threonine-protein phosphatase [Piscinibacter lacus]
MSAARLDPVQISHRGGRRRNEDRVGHARRGEATLLLLADGMGGHPDGDVAAQLALQTLDLLFARAAQPRIAAPATFLAEAVHTAHRQLVEHARLQALDDTPRTTLVACLVQEDEAWWAHCGDSRIYLLRDGHLLARTRDHSYAEMPPEAAEHLADWAQMNRHVLFTCLGSPTPPRVDVAGPLPLQPGDCLMLCSDGLWGNLDEDMLVAALSDGPPEDALPALAEAALDAGGPRCDNVSALALRWPGPGLAEAESAEGSTIEHRLKAPPLPGA